MTKIDAHDYSYLVVCAPAKNHSNPENIHFLGSAFLISSSGLVATCAHVIEKCKKGYKIFISSPKYPNLTNYELTNIRIHPDMDFAVGQVNIPNSLYFLPYEEELCMGQEIMSYGYVAPEKKEGQLYFTSRLVKGYIMRIVNSSHLNIRGRIVCELSCPSYAGFSGGAVFSSFFRDGVPRLAGMLFNNLESSIEVYSYHNVDAAGEKVTETTSRINEFGLMHTINEIKQFVVDMDLVAFV